MSVTITSLKCPNCGASILINQKECAYCHSQVIIESLNNINNIDINSYIKSYQQALDNKKDDVTLNNSLAMCYLKLKRYDKAIEHFNLISSENITNSNYYYYYSIALLEGKKAFLTQYKIIKYIINLLETAILVSDKPLYHCFLAYIKYDFYKRKSLKIQPDYKEEINMFKNNLSETDISNFYIDLNQEEPDILKIERGK